MTNNLQSQRTKLLAELAELDKQIGEEQNAFDCHDVYLYPEICPWQCSMVSMRKGKVYEDEQLVRNPDSLFMFKTKAQCESFNKKLLELAEREAQILYGVVEKPKPQAVSQLAILFDGEYLRVVDSEASENIYSAEQIKVLRDYCNQCLAYLEQQEARDER